MSKLQSLDRLSPQSWMTSAATGAVLDALQSGGAEVRFVGGCVRDAVRGFQIKDIDLATPDRPETVMSLLKAAGLKAIPTGIDHGTVTAVSSGEVYEITTLREDVDTDGRRAKVAYTDDWVQDAARRDLTINALSCRPDGLLFDPFGGLDDLKKGRVRFVGDAQARITEDYLRLLRFFRFHAYYGAQELDREGLAAAKLLAPNLTSLSGERVRDELLRLLAAKDPMPVLASMLDTGVIKILLPEARPDFEPLKSLIATEAKCDPILRLAAFLTNGSEPATQVAERLRFSRAQADRLITLCTAGQAHSDWPPKVTGDRRALRQALYDLGVAMTRDVLQLDWAIANAGKTGRDPSSLTKALAVTDDWEEAVFPLRGRDALDLGAKAGPLLGDALDRVEVWWRQADFAPDRDACLGQLKVELANA